MIFTEILFPCKISKTLLFSKNSLTTFGVLLNNPTFYSLLFFSGGYINFAVVTRWPSCYANGSRTKKTKKHDKSVIQQRLLSCRRGERPAGPVERTAHGRNIAFRFLQLQLDIDEEKYQQLIEKRRAAAQRRWAKYANDANNANASFAMLEEEGEKEGEAEGEKEGEGEGEAEADGEKEDDDAAAAALNNNNAREARKASAAAQQDIFLRFKKEAPKTILPWINEILDDAGSKIPRLKYMTQKRIERLFALMQQYGNAAIGEALRKAARSPFLNGRGKRNQFVADIDWVLSEQHFLEVLEGKYNTE